MAAGWCPSPERPQQYFDGKPKLQQRSNYPFSDMAATNDSQLTTTVTNRALGLIARNLEFLLTAHAQMKEVNDDSRLDLTKSAFKANDMKHNMRLQPTTSAARMAEPSRPAPSGTPRDVVGRAFARPARATAPRPRTTALAEVARAGNRLSTSGERSKE